MSLWFWILIAALAAVAVALAVAAVAVSRRSRRTHLRERFGPEYDRVVDDASSRRAAEKELAGREERLDELDVHPLGDGARERHAEGWREVQSHFVDDPRGALRDAEHLVRTVMGDRGYPDAGFEQRAADLSVDHPDRVERYRSAYAVYERERDGKATTEELRRALVDYRALLDELLERDAGAVAAR